MPTQSRGHGTHVIDHSFSRDSAELLFSEALKSPILSKPPPIYYYLFTKEHSLRSTRVCMTAFIGLIAFLGGCNEGSKKASIEGTVQFKGQPLDQGTIQFFPESGGPPLATISIQQGKFSQQNITGLAAGKYRVVISSGDASKPEDTGMPGQSGPPAKERIPPEYNRDSLQKPVVKELTAGTNNLSFDIP